MAAPKRLVLFVEGEGDAMAAPVLVKSLLNELQAWEYLFLDRDPFRVGAVTSFFGKKEGNWKNKLLAAAKRGSLGGVLLLQDGDVELRRGEPFCAKSVGYDLCRRAREAGAGAVFSVACVFARQEFESWLIAGIESLAGQRLAGGSIAIPAGTRAPEGDLEEAPRWAKGWLGRCMPSGYRETSDHLLLTQAVDIAAIRRRGLRSFHRLESALRQLIDAVRSGRHIVTPTEPSS